VRVRLKKAHKVGGFALVVGAEVNVPSSTAATLIRLGIAEELKGKPAKPTKPDKPVVGKPSKAAVTGPEATK